MAAVLNCGTGRPTGGREFMQSTERGAVATKRYHAVSMQLAAYLDGHYVELHIVTNDGESIAVACARDSIFALRQHIEQIGRQCPEIASWNQAIALPADSR